MVNLETAIVNLIRQIKDRNTKKGNVIIHRNTILIHLVMRLAVNSIKLQNNNYTYKKIFHESHWSLQLNLSYYKIKLNLKRINSLPNYVF